MPFYCIDLFLDNLTLMAIGVFCPLAQHEMTNLSPGYHAYQIAVSNPIASEVSINFTVNAVPFYRTIHLRFESEKNPIPSSQLSSFDFTYNGPYAVSPTYPASLTLQNMYKTTSLT